MTSARALERRIPEIPVKTRERLLDTAERLFAERGFRAVSVRVITSHAGCNIAAVNYYFGGKENLYREMFRRRLGALREQRISSIRLAMAEAGSGAGLELPLRAFTTAFLEPHLDQSGGRRLMRLFSRELLEPHLKSGTLQREVIEPVHRALVEAIQAVCPGLDARAARRSVHSLVAQLVHVVHMRNAPGILRGAGREDFSFPAVVDHIVRFSAAGIRGSLP
jgi:AcrR family transcriptional regulator